MSQSCVLDEISVQRFRILGLPLVAIQEKDLISVGGPHTQIDHLDLTTVGESLRLTIDGRIPTYIDWDCVCPMS